MTNDDSNSEFSRRNLMKNTTAFGVSALGFGSLATGSATAEDKPFNVTNTTELDQSQAQAEFAQAQSFEQVGGLVAGMENDVDLSANTEKPFALSVETDDEQVNKANPSVVFLAMGRDNVVSRGNAAGLVVSVVADTTPEAAESNRKPVMAYGMTSEQSDTTLASSGSSDDVLMKSYAYDESQGVSVVNQDTVSSQEFTGGRVSPSQDLIGCAICVPLVTQLCDKGTGTIGKMVCVKACTPFLASSPLGYAACAASCVIIVDTINNYGCAAGASAVCKAADLC